MWETIIEHAKVKIVVNNYYGGFGLSEAAYEFLGIKWDGHGYAYNDDEKRADPKLVECVEKLGKAASGRCADLRVVEVAFKTSISSYDGVESVSAWGEIEYLPQVQNSKGDV